MKLSELENIGKNLEEKLVNVNINTPEDLVNTGSERVFLLLKAVDSSTCINTLYALEGAVQNIRWHKLDKSRKDELLQFFRQS